MELTSEGLGVVLNAQGVAEVIVFGLLVLSGIFQILNPKDKKPWTWLWNKTLESVAIAVKKEYEPVMEDAYKRLDALDNQIKEVDAKVTRLDKESKEHIALGLRRRIIEAADELRHGMPHSDEWFGNILDACSEYEDYCMDHPKFPNEKAKASIVLIKEHYTKLLHTVQK